MVQVTSVKPGILFCPFGMKGKIESMLQNQREGRGKGEKGKGRKEGQNLL